MGYALSFPESHREDDFLTVVFRSINTQGPDPKMLDLPAPRSAARSRPGSL